MSAPDQRRARLKAPLLVLGVVVLFVALWFLNRDEPLNAGAGDCLKGATPSSAEIVDCDSADARYVVLGRVADRTDEEAGAVSTICGQWPDTTLDFWHARSGSKGDVFCLKVK